MVSAMFQTIFQQPDAQSTWGQHDDWIQQKRYMSLSALEQTKHLMHHPGDDHGDHHQLTA